MSFTAVVAAREQFDTSQGFAAVDFTSAVKIAEFLAACRFWLIATLLILLSNWVIIGNPSFFQLQLPLIVLLYLTASCLERYPNRTALLFGVWALILSAGILSLVSLILFVVSVQKDFSVALLLPLAVVVLFFCICWRTSKRREEMADIPEPANFMTLGLGGIAQGVVTPTLVEVWLSGGYRSMVLFVHVWVFSTLVMEAKAMPTCFFLAAAIGCAAVIPWSLLPLRNALDDAYGAEFLKALARNPRRTERGPTYALFVLRHTWASPRAMMWLALAVLLFSLAGIFYAAGTGIIFLDVVSTHLGGLAPLIGILLACGAFVWWKRSRQYAMDHAAGEAAGDSRDFALYLRSFLDDQVEVLRDGLFFRVWFVDPLFNAIRLLRFEEVLVPSVWPFGEVRALGRPGDAMPQIGALRLAPLPSDVQWQELVRSLVANARLILMTVGFTSGLRWEFQQLLRSAELRKLSLVLPPESPEARVSTWRQFSRDCALPFSCPEDVLTRTIAIRFTGYGKLPIFFTARSPSAHAFRLALKACWLEPDTLLQRGTEPVVETTRRLLGPAAWVAAFVMTALLPFAFGGSTTPTAMDQMRLTLLSQAEAGEPSAMYALAAYEDQQDQNSWRARQWLLKAAAAGNVDAMEHLGELYERGQGVGQNLRRAKHWYREAIEAGSDSASMRFQELLTAEKILRLAKKAAVGDASAMFELGRRYSEGAGVIQDPEQGQHWYKEAAERGNTAAMFRLGVLYSNGLAPGADYRQARSWYEKAADKGYAKAAYNLGRLYEQGDGVPRDSGLARRWYEKAAVLGDPEAMLSLGVLYENGRSVSADYARARQFYESTISAKEEICKPRPSDCKSSGPSQYSHESSAPFEEPSEAFDAQELRQDVHAAAVAMNNLGTLYYRGLGGQPDYNEAGQWFGRSAEENYPPAMVNLAILWQKGGDYDEARSWLRKAAELGSEEAERRLLSLPLQPQSSPER